MMKNTAKSETSESMAQAESRWGISKEVQRIAKRAGCRAFAGSRIHRAELEKWIRDNPAKARAAEKQGQQKQVLAELQRQKLQAEVDLLNARIAREESDSIRRADAKAEWDRAHRIDCEEAQALLPPDHFAIYVARTASRIGVLFGEQTTTITKP
jgi:hypothetical protein